MGDFEFRTPQTWGAGGLNRKLGGQGGLTEQYCIAGDFADIPGSRSLSTLYRTLTGGARHSGTGITATIFFLREGTPLEVSVNKTFSLNIPEKPLELDLRAIAPDREIAVAARVTASVVGVQRSSTCGPSIP